MKITPFKNRTIDLTKPVQVYKNLNKACWSIRQNGKVVGHSLYLVLKNCVFKVNMKANERVKVTHERCVHAWVEGLLVDRNFKFDKYQEVTYNPYKDRFFEVNDYGCKLNIKSARYCVFSENKVSVKHPETCVMLSDAAYEQMRDELLNPKPLSPEVLKRWSQVWRMAKGY